MRSVPCWMTLFTQLKCPVSRGHLKIILGGKPTAHGMPEHVLASGALFEVFGRVDGQEVAHILGRWSPGGASAERMYRTLTDPGYQRTTNKHGRRLNSRKCTPMHHMAAHALRQLPNQRGNLNQVSFDFLALNP
jgi:hypothetical protein